jgi:hypothetical protein
MSDGGDPLDPRLRAAFAARRVAIDAATLSARARAAAAPALAARAAFWPRLLRVLAIALMPLPLLVAADAAVIACLYGVADAWLPHGVAIYLAASYATAALVSLGLSYASIPLLVARRPPGEPLAA